jgi:hypothetical protein
MESYGPVLIHSTMHPPYCQMVDLFTTNIKGSFARVVVVNPLHDKLPRLVLVACCTCNCFKSAWVKTSGKLLTSCGRGIALLLWVL